jgi:RND family efflux transporter MFP subunit
VLLSVVLMAGFVGGGRCWGSEPPVAAAGSVLSKASTAESTPDSERLPQDGVLFTIEDCQIRPVQRGLLAVSRFGVLTRMAVSVGDSVQKGDIVASLDDRIAAANLALAQRRVENDVDLRFAKAFTDVAQADYEAAQRLYELKATSTDSLRKQKLELNRGQLRIEQHEHERELLVLEAERAARDLEALQVIAPYDGRVVRVLKGLGEGVHEGEGVVEIVNTDRVYVEGYGSIQDLWQLPQDMQVRVRLNDARLSRSDAGQKLFDGQLRLVDSAVQPVTGRVRVVVEVLANKDNILREGLKAQILFGQAAK